MVDRTGLHTAPVPGTPPIGTAPVDGRIVQAALFGSLGQCLNGGGYAASPTTMAFTMASGVYQIPDTANGGAVYHSPVDSAVLTPAAGQAGGRIDSIYVLQQDYEKNGTTSRVIYGLAAGTPGSGSAPSLSGVAGGPMRLMNITVPAAATKATDCTVTWVVPPATLALDGAIAANKALLDLMPGQYTGQRGFSGGIDYRWVGASWRPWDSDWIVVTSPVVYGITGAVNATPGWTTSAEYRYVAGQVRFRGEFGLNPGTTSAYSFNITLPVNAAVVGNRARMIGDVAAKNASASYAEYALRATANATQLYISSLGANGALQSASGTSPFGEAWAQSDIVAWDVLFDPA